MVITATIRNELQKPQSVSTGGPVRLKRTTARWINASALMATWVWRSYGAGSEAVTCFFSSDLWRFDMF